MPPLSPEEAHLRQASAGVGLSQLSLDRPSAEDELEPQWAMLCPRCRVYFQKSRAEDAWACPACGWPKPLGTSAMVT